MIRSLINWPNLLTLTRILLTPIIVYAILEGRPLQALGLMLVAGLTDMLDGAIAKHCHMQTVVGAYMDPIADKLMLVSTIVSLFIIHQTPLYLFLAVVFRDIIIVVGALAYELVTRRLEMRPTYLSKATTVMQIVYVSTALLNMTHPLAVQVMQIVLWSAFLLTCASGIQYMIIWTLKALREEEA